MHVWKAPERPVMTVASLDNAAFYPPAVAGTDAAAVGTLGTGQGHDVTSMPFGSRVPAANATIVNNSVDAARSVACARRVPVCVPQCANVSTTSTWAQHICSAG